MFNLNSHFFDPFNEWKKEHYHNIYTKKIHSLKIYRASNHLECWLFLNIFISWCESLEENFVLFSRLGNVSIGDLIYFGGCMKIIEPTEAPPLCWLHVITNEETLWRRWRTVHSVTEMNGCWGRENELLKYFCWKLTSSGESSDHRPVDGQQFPSTVDTQSATAAAAKGFS